jgi:acetyltransferase-like isoleucine patch superfamily enzyme
VDNDASPFAATLDDDVLLGYQGSRRSDPRLVLGDGARIRSGTVLYAGSRIGRRFETGHHVVVREENRLGDDVSVWSNTMIDYGCIIGDRTKIHCNCYVAQLTEIEDDVFLAPGVTIANDLFPGFEISARAMRGPSIGAGAQIGVNATILPYVRIGERAIVGAGSVVTKNIPDETLAYGVPAIPICDIRDVPVRQRVLERATEAANRGQGWPAADLISDAEEA